MKSAHSFRQEDRALSVADALTQAQKAAATVVRKWHLPSHLKADLEAEAVASAIAMWRAKEAPIEHLRLFAIGTARDALKKASIQLRREVPLNATHQGSDDGAEHERTQGLALEQLGDTAQTTLPLRLALEKLLRSPRLEREMSLLEKLMNDEPLSKTEHVRLHRLRRDLNADDNLNNWL